MIIPLGGGGSKVVASIVVTYPAGSTLTCTLGSKVLTAKDTSGKWVFELPSTGNWVVKAVKGSKSKSATVEITAEAQVETLTLTYQLDIFKSGSGLTSGYSVENSDVTVSKNSISWSGDANGGGISMYITPAVVLKDYTKLCVDFECSYNWGGDYGMAFGVGKDAATGTMITNTSWTAKVKNGANPISRNTAQCDISKLTDSEYIKVVGSYSAGKIYNIWLE